MCSRKKFKPDYGFARNFGLALLLDNILTKNRIGACLSEISQGNICVSHGVQDSCTKFTIKCTILHRQHVTIASGTSRATCTYVISQFVFTGSPCVSARPPVKSGVSSANYPLLTFFSTWLSVYPYTKRRAPVSYIFFQHYRDILSRFST